MKEKKIGVSKVVIQIGDKEASLTVEQVRELRAALDALLGSEKTVVERWYPQWWYVQPPYTSGTVTYGSTTITTSDSPGTYTITMNDTNGLLTD